MSTFFKDTDLTRQEADRLVSETLKNCDDGELFFESSKNESFVLDDNKIKNTSYDTSLGYGLRAVTDDVTAYSHSNEISKKSLTEASKSLLSSLKIRMEKFLPRHKDLILKCILTLIQLKQNRLGKRFLF